MDICIYMSDQHAFGIQGYAGDPLIRTPNLDRIAAAGTAMMSAYTPYPVCVPARMAMMSGQYASRCGVMSNFSALDSNRVTFAHCLSAAGYETVLCGRMHFVGPDQRHGFEKRICGDITQVFHNRPAAIAEERGVHNKTPQGSPTCLSIIGGGNSPTLEFDRDVTSAAVEYLSKDHDRPQMLVVGTYGPHHPYVAPEELYEYYYDRISVPVESFDYPPHPVTESLMLKDTDLEVVRAVRAAYYGMVEFEDQKIGMVYDAFQAYLKRNRHEGVFIYISDHGDHIGNRGYYGKGSFYEPSAHIPMIFAGTGIAAGRRIEAPVSLLDIGPTLCEATGAAELPRADGVSLYGMLTGKSVDEERMVVSECGGDMTWGGFFYGKMCRWKQYKLIHYYDHDREDLLYDLRGDPEETVNVIDEYPEVVGAMRGFMDTHCDVSRREIEYNAQKMKDNIDILLSCDFDDEKERWHAPDAARHYPKHMVSSKIKVEDWMKERMKKQQ